MLVLSMVFEVAVPREIADSMLLREAAVAPIVVF
jgi:hypothetical protein